VLKVADEAHTAEKAELFFVLDIHNNLCSGPRGNWSHWTETHHIA